MARRNGAPTVSRQVASNLRLLSDMAHAPADDGRLVHDRVVAANASLFTEAFFSEPLTAYALGWKDPEDISETLQFFAPEVTVPRRFEYAEHNNAEEWLSDESSDDARAIKGEFTEVEYTDSKVDAKTLNRGLKIVVDLDQVADKTGWREHYTGKLTRRLQRNALRRAIALLSAAATNQAYTWDTTAGKDPDQDILGQLILAADASGIYPNRVGYGQTAWSKRALAHRAQTSAGGFASAGSSEAEVAGFLGVDRVHVSKERYQSAAAAKTQIVSNLVLQFSASDSVDTEDPSNIKRFVSPVEGGGNLRVYERQVTSKLYEIVVEHYELIRITSTLGIRKATIS